MRAILISINPKWMCKILNGEKKDEIRKGTAIHTAIQKLIKTQGKAILLAYCTSHKNYTQSLYEVCEEDGGGYDVDRYRPSDPEFILNGKVVAKLEVASETIGYHFGYYTMGEWAESYILERSCLTAEELDGYIKASQTYDEKKVRKPCGTSIHINKVETFEKPKELKDLYRLCDGNCAKCRHNSPDLEHDICNQAYESIKNAPQSWCYCEYEE